MDKTIAFSKLIILTVFMSPFSAIVTFSTGFADLKLIQGLWVIVFMIMMVKKAGDKRQLLAGDTNASGTDKAFKAFIVLYLSALVISSLYSVNIAWSVKEFIQYLYLIILMYTIYHFSKEYDMCLKIIKAMVAANTLMVCICIISYITKATIIPSYIVSPYGIYVNRNLFSTNTLMDTGEQILRLNGVMGLGATAIANLILIQSLFVNYLFRISSGKKKILYLLLLAANLITMIMTYSRVGILLFILVQTATLMNKSQVRNIFVLLFAGIACYCLLSIFPTVLTRILETFNTEERSSKYHFAIWLIAAKTGLKHVLTGIGLGNMAFNYHTFSSEFYQFGIPKINGVNVHNYALQIWAEQGLGGVLANFLLLVSPLLYYFKVKFLKIAEKTMEDFIFLAFFSTLVYNLTNNNFYIETFWILAGLIYFSKDRLRYMVRNDTTGVIRYE